VKAGLLAAGLLALAALVAPRAAERAREAATDALMRALPRPPAPVPVIAVAVDAPALAAFGPWPWPRPLLARLVAATAAAGPAGIALDVAVDDPASGDAALAAAFAAAPLVQAVLAGPAPPPAGLGVALIGGPDLAALPLLPGVAPPAVAGAPVGFAGLPGSVVRTAPLLLRAGAPGEDAAAGLLPGLALAGLARALEAPAIVLRGGAPVRIELGPFALDLPADGLLRLHPAAAGVPVVGARDVLEGGAAAAALRGRLVMLGVTAPGAAALRESVLGPFVPSLLLQAEAAAQLAAGWVPRRLPGGAAAEAALAVLLGALAAAMVRRRAGAGLLGAGVLALGWVAAAGAALRLGPLLADPLLPAAAVLLGGATEAAAAALRAAREKARLVARFAHRLPTGVAERLLATPEAERLKPERREVAVVMTDLAGFSAMVRSGDPQRVVAALNAYLAGVERAMLAQGATLERLIGDSVLGVFGAPVPMPDHGRRAIAAARAVDAFAEAFRRRPEAVALGFGETRIGVAAGEVMVGELGGSRLTWTVCGDAANTAARLQELGKTVGVRALVSGIDDPSLPPPLGRFDLRGVGQVVVRPLAAGGG
jgi:adenylate cyclase